MKVIITTILIALAGLFGYGFQDQQLGGTKLYPYQGGTGISSAVVGDVGTCLKVSDDSPFSYELGACGTGGGGASNWQSANFTSLALTPTSTLAGIFVRPSSTISMLNMDNATITNDLILGSTYIDDWYGSSRLRFNADDGNNSDYTMTVAGGGFGTQVFASADGTLTTPLGADASQILGALYFYGYASTGYQNAAQILASIAPSGTISDTSMPGLLEFKTSANGQTNPVTQLSITSTGVTSTPRFVVGSTQPTNNFGMLWLGGDFYNYGNATTTGNYRITGELQGGKTTLLRFTPQDGEAPSSNFAFFDTRNDHPILQFYEGARQCMYFTDVMPWWYSGQGITLNLFTTATGTSGSIGGSFSFEKLADASHDIDADSFSAKTNIATTTVSATSGNITKISTNVSNSLIDSIVGGDGIRIRYCSSVSSDADTQVRLLEIREQ